ncbi:MAG: hypothetical protein LBN24_02800 [Mediterranea sp.]|nr:hypothetical protein [Mediterranea sp.]
MTDIESYQILSNNSLIVVNDKNEISLNNMSLGKVELARHIYVCSTDILIAELRNRTAYIIRDSMLHPFLGLDFSVSNVINKKMLILYKRDKLGRKTYYIYDYDEHRLLREISRYINYLYNDFTFGYNETEIYAYRISTGDIQWQYSIQDYPRYIDNFEERNADIKQILGVYKDILWVHVGGFQLIGLDIHTGERKHYVEDIWLEDKSTDFLDTKSGILRSLCYDHYYEFNLNSLQFIKQVKIDNGLTIRGSNSYPDDKCLYFCGHYNKSTLPNAFGIFDTEKAEIVWYDTRKPDGGYFYNPPQANDKHLAILDDKHNLLIYNREKDE